MAVGLLLLGVLLVVVLLRLRALAGRGLDSEIKTRLDTLSAQNERLERELRAERPVRAPRARAFESRAEFRRTSTR
jgi:hypothetical protein